MGHRWSNTGDQQEPLYTVKHAAYLVFMSLQGPGHVVHNFSCPSSSCPGKVRNLSSLSGFPAPWLSMSPFLCCLCIYQHAYVHFYAHAHTHANNYMYAQTCAHTHTSTYTNCVTQYNTKTHTHATAHIMQVKKIAYLKVRGAQLRFPPWGSNKRQDLHHQCIGNSFQLLSHASIKYQ